MCFAALKKRNTLFNMKQIKNKTAKFCGLIGADDGTRTRDLLLTKEVLYLLSYISKLIID